MEGGSGRWNGAVRKTREGVNENDDCRRKIKRNVLWRNTQSSRLEMRWAGMVIEMRVVYQKECTPIYCFARKDAYFSYIFSKKEKTKAFLGLNFFLFFKELFFSSLYKVHKWVRWFLWKKNWTTTRDVQLQIVHKPISTFRIVM